MLCSPTTGRRDPHRSLPSYWAIRLGAPKDLRSWRMGFRRWAYALLPPADSHSQESAEGRSMASEQQHGDGQQDEAAGLHEDPRDPAVNMLRDISRAMVRLYKEQFGRGPEHVSTHYSGPDTIVSILGNSLTPVERTMRDIGEQQRLRDIRLMFQHATEPQFRAAVEEVTGRRV